MKDNSHFKILRETGCESRVEMKSLDSIAANFFHVFYTREWLGDGEPYISNLSIAEAYEVQNLVAEKRIETGEIIVGFKVGCTSPAIRSQFGLSQPIHGRLFQPHIFNENVRLDWSNYVNCAIEPEMVLTIGKDLRARAKIISHFPISASGHLRSPLNLAAGDQNVLLGLGFHSKLCTFLIPFRR